MSIRGQGHSLTFAKGDSDFKIKNLFFSEIVGSFETKFHLNADARIGMKI